MIGKAISYKLKSDPALAVLVGTRIKPDVADVDDAFPQVVYEEEEGELDGVYGTASLENTEITVACIGHTKKASADVAAAVKACLHDAAGEWAGIEVQGVFLTSANSSVQTPDEDTRFYIQELNFKVWYRPELNS
jgi:hypothetical protein